MKFKNYVNNCDNEATIPVEKASSYKRNVRVPQITRFKLDARLNSCES